MKNRLLKVIILILILGCILPINSYANSKDKGKDQIYVLKDVTEPIDQDMAGNLTVVMGSAKISSDVNGSVVVVFGDATISGSVSGDVVSIFSEVRLLDNAHIKGNLVSLGSLSKSENTVIEGTQQNISLDFTKFFNSNNMPIIILIFLALFTLVFGLILISMLGDRYRVMSYSIKIAFGRKFAMGSLILCSLTIVMIFLIFLLPIPLIYVLILLFCEIIGSISLGKLIITNNSRSSIYIEFLIGHILVSIFKIVPIILIPLGNYTDLLIYGIAYMVVEFYLVAIGLGTIIDTRYGKCRGRK